MEETLVTIAVDLSGRNYVVFNAPMPSPKIGEFDSELVEDFWYAFASNALCNFHVVALWSQQSITSSEAIFKGAARALRQAITVDPRNPESPVPKARYSQP